MPTASQNVFRVHRDNFIPGVGTPYVIVVAWKDGVSDDCFGEAYILLKDERDQIHLNADGAWHVSFTTHPDAGPTARTQTEAADLTLQVAQGQLLFHATAYWEKDKVNRAFPMRAALPAVEDKTKALREVAGKPTAADQLRKVQNLTRFPALRTSVNSLLA